MLVEAKSGTSMGDPYLYPESEVLKNLADIHDMDILKDMEADYSSFRL